MWNYRSNYSSLRYRKLHTITTTPASLTHWGRVTHICVSKLTGIGSDNGLSPGRRQAIIWTNAGILLIGPIGTNFNEIFYRNSCIFIQENSFENVVCEMASILYRPQCVNSLFPESMMTSSNGNIFRATGPLWGDSTGHQRIPLTKASDAELLCFLWFGANRHLNQYYSNTYIYIICVYIYLSNQTCVSWHPPLR